MAGILPRLGNYSIIYAQGNGTTEDLRESEAMR
jgi:hypothetical protein